MMARYIMLMVLVTFLGGHSSLAQNGQLTDEEVYRLSDSVFRKLIRNPDYIRPMMYVGWMRLCGRPALADKLFDKASVPLVEESLNVIAQNFSDIEGKSAQIFFGGLVSAQSQFAGGVVVGLRIFLQQGENTYGQSWRQRQCKDGISEVTDLLN